MKKTEKISKNEGYVITLGLILFLLYILSQIAVYFVINFFIAVWFADIAHKQLNYNEKAQWILFFLGLLFGLPILTWVFYRSNFTSKNLELNIKDFIKSQLPPGKYIEKPKTTLEKVSGAFTGFLKVIGILILIIIIIAFFFGALVGISNNQANSGATQTQYNSCDNVVCNDYCSGNIRYVNGYCENGQCKYYSSYCQNGCSNGECNSNPTLPISPSSETSQNYDVQSYENGEPYYSAYCDKINPYDLDVRKAAAEAIKNHAGSYNINQLFDIYDWVKQNIVYQNVALVGIPYNPSETLATKSGDCKNQAVLIASMVRAIGGTAKVVADTICEHAYTIVRFGPSGSDISWFTQAVANHYGSDVQVRYFISDSDIWVYFDPAGGNYPGNTLPECSGNRTVYFITSCLDCINQYPNEPYTFGDKCYSQCPSGTIIANQHACKSCPEGSYSCNNQCLSCPIGSYLATDCRCYSR